MLIFLLSSLSRKIDNSRDQCKLDIQRFMLCFILHVVYHYKRSVLITKCLCSISKAYFSVDRERIESKSELTDPIFSVRV